MSEFLYGGNVFANGIRQHYLRYGGATGAREGRDAVVIVPGITSPAVTWGFVGEQFGKHFDTYILDVRGRGLSEAGDALDYSLDAQAADVTAFKNSKSFTLKAGTAYFFRRAGMRRCLAVTSMGSLYQVLLVTRYLFGTKDRTSNK